MKKKYRSSRSSSSSAGISLIELLVALGALLTILAIAVPIYNSMISRARTVTAVTDMKLIAGDIKLYEVDHGFYPESLNDLGKTIPQDPWGRPYEYLRLEDPVDVGNDSGGRGRGGRGGGGGGGGVGQSRKDHNLVPINSDFDLYSKGPDGQSLSPLTAQPSRDDIIRANNGGFYGIATDF